MRKFWVTAVCVSVLAGGVVLPPAAVADPVAVDGIVLEGAGPDPTFGQDITFDPAAGAAWSASVGPNSVEVRTTVSSPGDSPRFADLAISTADGMPFQPHTTYAVGSGSPAVQVGLQRDGTPCGATGGSVTVEEVTTDADGVITSFAATLDDLACSVVGTTTTVSGSLRMASSLPLAAITTSPRTWDFGEHIIDRDGGAAISRHFVVDNGSDAPVTFGAATLVGNTTVFSLGSDTCSGTTLAPGESCGLTVRAHTVRAVGAAGRITLPTTSGQATRVIPVRITGTPTSTTYVQAGPERATIHAGRLPTPIDAVVDGDRIYHGTSRTSLTRLRDVPVGAATTNRSLHAGTTYYYAVRPLISGSGPGEAGQLIAADPWPRYSAGMYHRVRAARVLNQRAVRAGRPLTVRLGGAHGIPAGHVEAVALNVTVTRPSADTSVSVYPAGTRRPAAADVSVRHGDTRSDLVIARVDRRGRVTIASTRGSAPVTVDVSGYYSGTGLTSAGSGGSLHTFAPGYTLLDTHTWKYGALEPHYYATVPLNFSAYLVPHVTSVVVTITATSSRGGGTLTVAPGATDREPVPSVLAYSAGTASAATAIVATGRVAYGDGTLPTFSIFNRGTNSVHVKISLTGFYDDNAASYGARYVPSTPVRLLAAPLSAGGRRTILPGRHAQYWTTAMNLKVTATDPRATAVSLWPGGYSDVTRADQPQLRVASNRPTTAASLVTTGSANRIVVGNSAGAAHVSVWSFGRFDFWPVPDTDSYVGATPAVATASADAAAGTSAFASPARMGSYRAGEGQWQPDRHRAGCSAGATHRCS